MAHADDRVKNTLVTLRLADRLRAVRPVRRDGAPGANTLVRGVLLGPEVG